MKNILLPVLVLLFLQIKSSAQTQWKTTSPDRSLSIVLSDNGGKLSYKVFSNQDVVIGSSQLGIRTTEEDFTTGLTFVNTVTRKVNQDYELKIGKRKINHVSATETQVVFKNKNNVQIRIDLCAYNDGVAFRYGFLQNGKTITVTADMSQFHVPAGKTWLEPYGKASDYGPAYEEIFENGIATGTKQVKENGGWAFPALFKTAKNWLLITESGLYENFFGSHLTQRAEGNIYELALPDAGEAKGTGSVTAVAVAPFNTPWRTIIVGKSLGTIVESNLVYHLSESNQIKEDSWIKPGRASWSWWSEHDSSRDLDALKKFIDLSKTMNWEYSLIDANWNIMKNGGHIDELVKYASVQKIDLLLWYNSGGPHNTVTEQPRDILSDPIKRKAEFAKLQKWGVKGIKVDFFQSDKQEVIKLYVAILKDAAAAHLLVNFHGCTLPRGWSRTFQPDVDGGCTRRGKLWMEQGVC